MDDERDISGYTGKQGHIPAMKLNNRIIAVEYVYAGKDEVVRYYTDELTALCPKTGLPDFYTLEIEYIPNSLLVELKSLKLYLTEYRNIGIFYEHLAMKIYEDIMEVISAKWLKVRLKARKRGGIGAEVIVDSNKL